jgi:hypothetical protein
MTPATISNVILAAIAASWATATPIAWPNHSFTEPAGPWIRPTIKMGDTLVGELGTDGIGMRTGLLMISIFDLANKGSQAALAYAGRLEGLFRRRERSGVNFDEPSSDPKGIDDNGYFQVIMSCGFTTWVGE